MEIIDNINRLLGDDLKQVLKPGSKLKVAASCFSIYAYEALKAELEKIDSLQFIFTSPTFVPGEGITHEYYDHAYHRLSSRNEIPFGIVDVHDCKVLEVDDLTDLARAEDILRRRAATA